MDALRRRIIADLGAEDAAYIRQVVRVQRRLEMGHHVLHGQYDWMRDDKLNSRDFE